MWRVTWTPAGSPFPEWADFHNGPLADGFADVMEHHNGATNVRVYQLEEDNQ